MWKKIQQLYLSETAIPIHNEISPWGDATEPWTHPAIDVDTFSLFFFAEKERDLPLPLILIYGQVPNWTFYKFRVSKSAALQILLRSEMLICYSKIVMGLGQVGSSTRYMIKSHSRYEQASWSLKSRKWVSRLLEGSFQMFHQETNGLPTNILITKIVFSIFNGSRPFFINYAEDFWWIVGKSKKKIYS